MPAPYIARPLMVVAVKVPEAPDPSPVLLTTSVSVPSLPATVTAASTPASVPVLPTLTARHRLLLASVVVLTSVALSQRILRRADFTCRS